MEFLIKSIWWQLHHLSNWIHSATFHERNGYKYGNINLFCFVQKIWCLITCVAVIQQWKFRMIVIQQIIDNSFNSKAYFGTSQAKPGLVLICWGYKMSGWAYYFITISLGSFFSLKYVNGWNNYSRKTRSHLNNWVRTTR